MLKFLFYYVNYFDLFISLKIKKKRKRQYFIINHTYYHQFKDQGGFSFSSSRSRYDHSISLFFHYSIKTQIIRCYYIERCTHHQIHRTFCRIYNVVVIPSQQNTTSPGLGSRGVTTFSSFCIDHLIILYYKKKKKRKI